MLDFKANIDHGKVFNSQIMIVNDQPNAENGTVLIRAKTAGPPIHKHNLQDEILEVVEGQLDVYKENRWEVIKKGESIFIPRNTAHTYKNTSESDTYFKYFISPQGTFTSMMYDFERIIKQEKIKSTKDFSSLIYMSMVFRKYKDSLSSVEPPDFVMSFMATLGKVLGFRI
ncbi:cupin domain-containing protein [Thermoflexibacter ruber]|uniref:Cupin domain-containing protein n=1 Tax=Thermoflexibacter ruber TaxID=1003 RepID=A0A1I2IDZ9_9BACT|nr:cupin domain-containing protein [Thermoflexibacter ruber]SFF40535.1 Cupin domain-containing protein [Thermoflexibacter ruber]